MAHPTASSQPQGSAPRRRLLPLLAVAAVVALTFSTTSCGKRPETVSTSVVDRRPASRPASEKMHAAPVESTDPKVPPTPEQAWSQGRWLKVITPDPNTPGGWAEGSFDRDKNKLIIVARHVRRFVINAHMIGIDWDRRVILSLNHANSELRRRDAGVLTFELDDHGRWVVLEPPASKRRD